ncbi:amidophosphoribosyltransferase [Cocleimonas flava]|uniref:Amidophosphoribosyltransferase n=1 Tax=Cocleimonas flava TaxID=634765 RepID=A0A4R1F3W2_9GAMM|nr:MULTISPECIES: amidophosphoribosyltransferase [Cocleimonas]MEB8433470.1 amidophosphoribosyltransferase [Cocleimonas sp. KMM 6892]MEC4716281.1 amidophosphoribosyltransferase [Cocleimonas sp. KMM 6895]MEC4745826.1 amidophosphoribosyltransferase [Cocleimonas sp. KMM 6896]TCJ85111.1 amidophosphoribosyltransferase [Cocleimonas flava]
MCGIIGILSNTPVNQEIYDGLLVLQHRGQDSAGMATSDGKRLYIRRKNGLVTDVFRKEHMKRLVGNMGVGHLRYPTAGGSSNSEAQPFYVNSPYGISLAHNGNLTNAHELKKELYKQDRRHINTSSDSEILLNIFAQELQKYKAYSVHPEEVFAAVEGVHKRCVGAYAVIAMITRDGIVGFRDPNGIRPLVLGKRESEQGTDYMLASESVALVTQGYAIVRDIEPGEAIFITKDGEVHTKQCSDKATYNSCIFEYVYFARPDSVIDKVYVHKARMRMGHNLAEKVMKVWPDHDIDVVIPIPDTSRTSALEMAITLGVPYREGYIKNRYIGRTFIMPGQKQRKKSVRRKLNPLDIEFKGKNVMLVDDSIVRGTTSKEIVQMARDSGAKNVYFASASPAIRYPNIYGIDMPAAKELIAHGRTEAEVAKEIGADRLVYQELDDLIDAITKGNSKLTQFDCSVFTGKYITGESESYFTDLEARRNDGKKKDKANMVAIDMSDTD